MSTGAYDQLLVVQGFDTQLLQLRHRRDHHPIQAEIDEAAARAAAVEATMAEIEVRKHPVDRELKRLEDEVALLEDRKSEINNKLYDGSVTGTKDLLALQDEAAMLVERQSGLEDQELELMEQTEVVGAELGEAESKLQAINTEISAYQEALSQDLVENEKAEVGLVSERQGAASEVPAELLSHYEGLLDGFDGVAVARLVGSTCDGCHMALSAVAIDKIKKMAADAVVTCDECGRLLVR